MNKYEEMAGRKTNLWLVFKLFSYPWHVFQCKNKQYVSIYQTMKVYNAQ